MSTESWDQQLVDAASRGDLEAVKLAIQQGADMHANNGHALQMGANNGNLDVVQYLMEQGVDVHADNDLALCWSAHNGHLNVVTYLVEHGADIHADNDCALRWGAGKGHLMVVQYLVQCGADIEVGIQIAQKNARTDIFNWLNGYQLAKQEKEWLLQGKEWMRAELPKARL